MVLSRKHYKAIADILKDAYKEDSQSEGLRIATRGLITFFKCDNSRFSESRFLSAVNSN